jgi:hypothetical protein
MFQAAYGDGWIPKSLETSRFAAVIFFFHFLSVADTRDTDSVTIQLPGDTFLQEH